MAKKTEYYKPGPMTEGKRSIIQGLLQEYKIESAADIQTGNRTNKHRSGICRNWTAPRN